MYDVIVVGAGPGGSAAAAWLAKAGVSVALIERHTFPRNKVCGDALTPQALWWIDALGCLDKVLDSARCAISRCDLFINKRKILTSAFPSDSPYPPFCTLLDRRKLDAILARYAQDCGATLLENRSLQELCLHQDHVQVCTHESSGKKHTYQGRIVIGADGAGSRVSRCIGNSVSEGVKALSMRAHFDSVKIDGAQVKVFFDEAWFPGYGWLFVDDSGHANIGVGCVSEPPYTRPVDLRAVFDVFVKNDLDGWMGSAVQSSPLSGGWVHFAEPRAISGERVMLIGDAANMADPLNGGGIHKAIESASLACSTAWRALESGRFDAATMFDYENTWNRIVGPDWRAAELLLTFAKNAFLSKLSLAALERIGGMIAVNPKLGDFAAGIFAGTTPRRAIFSPSRIADVFPRSMSGVIGEGLRARSLVADTTSLLLGGVHATRNSIRSPGQFARWCREIAERLVQTGTDSLDELLAVMPVNPDLSTPTFTGEEYGS
jgi:geranylgeranyl reductase family protein